MHILHLHQRLNQVIAFLTLLLLLAINAPTIQAQVKPIKNTNATTKNKFTSSVNVSHNKAIPAQNVVKVNVLSPMLRTFTASYERGLPQIHPQLSAQLTGSYGNFNFFGLFRKNGYKITPEIRYYLAESEKNRANLQGVYAATFINYQHHELSTSIEELEKLAKAELSAWGVGVSMGMQQAINKNLRIDFFAGPTMQFRNFQLKTDSPVDAFDFLLLPVNTGVGFRAGLNIGVAF